MTHIFLLTTTLIVVALAPAEQETKEQPDGLQPYVQVLRESGVEPVQFVLDRLRDHNLLTFDDGMHTAVEPFHFYQQLVREPAFHRQVKRIFLEVVPINMQPHLDAYLDTQPENPSLLYPAFQNDYGMGFPYKIYFDLLHTVYEVNQQLPKAERLKVIAVSNPVYWPEIKTSTDLELFRKSLAGRDALMYEVILEELEGFRTARKGIFLTNTRHAYDGIRDRQGRLYWNCQTYFHERHPGKTYSLRCYHLVLNIERDRPLNAAAPKTTAGTERFVYKWARLGRGRWDEAWQQLGNKPTALSLAGNVFGQEPYLGNHMLNVAKGQTIANAYDAVLFLVPTENLRQTAMAGEIYTPEFKKELARRYGVLYTPEQLKDEIKRAGVDTLEQLIDKRHVTAPEGPLPQLQGLEPVDTWRKQ